MWTCYVCYTFVVHNIQVPQEECARLWEGVPYAIKYTDITQNIYVQS
jgi:hypothetical protein